MRQKLESWGFYVNATNSREQLKLDKASIQIATKIAFPDIF